MSLSVKRILIDILDVMDDPMSDVFIHFDEENIQEILVVLVGPQGTPYDGGMFPFHLKFTNRYPSEPPKVTFLTPNEKVRFHPNLYQLGKVCLSILGTWDGPEWTSVMNLRSLILSLQSILSENPLRNEPGLESEPVYGKKNQNYNMFIRYVTVKFAVVETLKNPSRLKSLRDDLIVFIKKNISRYQGLKEALSALTSQVGYDGYMLRTVYGMKANIDTALLSSELDTVLADVQRV